MAKRRPKRRGGRLYSGPADPKSSVGAPPGQILAGPDAQPSRVTVTAYGPDQLVESPVESAAALRPLVGSFPVVWVNVDGLANVDLIRAIGEVFDLHPLALEDAVSNHQRAKVERYPTAVYVVLDMMNEAPDGPLVEQFSMFLGEGFVVTFQEYPGDCFEPVRNRIRAQASRIRRRGAGYLAYALVDALVDRYFPVVQVLGDRLEALEMDVLKNPTTALVGEILALKRDLLALRRSVWPLRDAVSLLPREASDYVTEETKLYLRDCYDHAQRVADMIEAFRELAFGFIDIYLSSQSRRTNEIMQVLTIISTIFIPLSFIAGVYGMNFDGAAAPLNMPELRWKYGYIACLGLMGTVAGVLLYYFYQRGWLSRDGLEVALEQVDGTAGPRRLRAEPHRPDVHRHDTPRAEGPSGPPEQPQPRE